MHGLALHTVSIRFQKMLVKMKVIVFLCLIDIINSGPLAVHARRWQCMVSNNFPHHEQLQRNAAR
jgi:hypothetical protein